MGGALSWPDATKGGGRRVKYLLNKSQLAWLSRHGLNNVGGRGVNRPGSGGGADGHDGSVAAPGAVGVKVG